MNQNENSAKKADPSGADLAIVDYGIGNLHSTQKSFQHVGANAVLTADVDAITNADAVILPGVGAFGATMAALNSTGLDNVVREVVEAGKPFLGICIGMQVLYEASDEAPGVAGLGLLDGKVQELSDQVKRPQMQWNRLNVAEPDHPLLRGLDGEWFYFLHTYAAEPTSAVIATASYGGEVTSVVAHNNIWATQFHPEKSAKAGLAMLTNFVEHVQRVS